MPKRAGVTLIELILVMALVVTLAGLTTVNFIRSYQSKSFNHFVNEFTSYLRYLQFKAIEEARIVKVAFDAESGLLTCYVKQKKSNEFEETKTPFSNRFQSADEFEIDIQKGDAVYFYPDGTITLNKFVITNTKNEEKATIEVRNRLGTFKVTFNVQTEY